MWALALPLAVVMGGTLGVLGGGGSILTVPLLVYVLGIDPKEAVAMSLLIVGATSLVAAAQHARAGHVRWRTALVFGGVSMVGAYGGGFVAQWIPGDVLLALFAGLMVVTAIAMLRPARALAPSGDAPRRAVPKLVAEGLVVGAVTGLIGAGGGFLVVPALVLLSRLPMRDAIGTSLAVIALKSFAGLAGHASHVDLDLPLAGAITAAAIVGSLAGGLLARRLDPAKLRRGFAFLVIGVAAVMLLQLLPAGARHLLLVERWPFWAGGAAIGLFVLLLLWRTGQPLGVSTGFADACGAVTRPEMRRSWRLPFIGGVAGGGLLSAVLAGGPGPTWSAGLFDAVAGFPANALLFGAGGILLGFGARLAGGCTSGHGIVGTALLAPASLIATGIFMVVGFAVTGLLLGGA